VFQYNKRDLRNILPVEKLQQSLNAGGAPAIEAAAVHGVGVFETLKEISRLSLASIRGKIAEQKRSGVAGVERRIQKPAPARAAAPKPAAPKAAAPATSEIPAAAGADPGGATPAATDPSLLEPLQVEFAEEDTDKLKVRAVKTHGMLDLGQELEKLRAITTDAKLKAPTAVKDREVDKLFKGLVPGAREAEQEISRRVALDVPEHLLRGLTDLRIHLGFDRSGREEIQRDAVRVTLVRTRKLRRLRLQLDLELKSRE